jgi:hypothetical protein
MGNQIRVFIVNSQTGYSGDKSFDSRCTVGDVFDMEIRNGNWNNYSVRLNRNDVRDRNTTLRDGDRLTFTPSKVDAGSR